MSSDKAHTNSAPGLQRRKDPPSGRPEEQCGAATTSAPTPCDAGALYMIDALRGLAAETTRPQFAASVAWGTEAATCGVRAAASTDDALAWADRKRISTVTAGGAAPPACRV